MPYAEMVAAGAGATGGEAYVGPVGDPIAMSGIASRTVRRVGGIGEGLGQGGGTP